MVEKEDEFYSYFQDFDAMDAATMRDHVISFEAMFKNEGEESVEFFKKVIFLIDYQKRVMALVEAVQEHLDLERDQLPMMVPGIRHATATQAYEESVVNLQQWIATAFPGELTKRSPEAVSMFERHSAHTRYSWITLMDDLRVIKAHKMSDAMFSFLVEAYQLMMNNAYLTISVLLRDSNYTLARGDEQPFTYPF